MSCLDFVRSLPRQWLAMTHPAFQGVQGKVEVSIDLLSADEARRRPGMKFPQNFYDT